jgi:bifunctional N-acetylglucosamine-1-phosphate-uridyltransferase/glucosamine-1-phosphate-acetyltransferase GlmU-like protein
MEIIVPAAGLSTRFPNMKPKYLLRDENGEMMLKKALEPYLDYTITVGLLLEHVEKYDALNEVQKEFNNKILTVVLPEVTKGPADTVYQILQGKVKQTGPFLIKDCDSFFRHETKDGNYVCVTQVAEHEVLINLGGKSFIVSNEQGIITDIVEKQVISDKFCVGGYKFDCIQQYMKTFEKIVSHNIQKEVFVSHIIQDMLLNDAIFFENHVTDYYDVGTAQDWKVYNESLAK